jgi:hypothetical protein
MRLPTYLAELQEDYQAIQRGETELIGSDTFAYFLG